MGLTVTLCILFICSVILLFPPHPHTKAPMSSPSDLKALFQDKVNKLFGAETDEEYKQTYESTFTTSVQIKLDSEALSREGLKNDLAARRSAAASSTVDWENAEFKAKNEQNLDDVRISLDQGVSVS